MQPLVAVLGEQQRPRRRTVAPRAARLLVVRLDRPRNALVADRAHVRLVDPHAERVRRHDDRQRAVHEPPLHRRALLAPEPRVVHADRAVERRRELDSELLGTRPRARVDDRRRRARRSQRGRDMAVLRHRRRARDDRERQVRAIEARRHAHRVAQAQPRLDVARDLRRGRRRRRDDRLRRKPPCRVGEAEVVRAKVVPPLRDAMRLVDDEQPDPRALHRLDERRRGEALRRDVQQPQLAGHRSLKR